MRFSGQRFTRRRRHSRHYSWGIFTLAARAEVYRTSKVLYGGRRVVTRRKHYRDIFQVLPDGKRHLHPRQCRAPFQIPTFVPLARPQVRATAIPPRTHPRPWRYCTARIPRDSPAPVSTVSTGRAHAFITSFLFPFACRLSPLAFHRLRSPAPIRFHQPPLRPRHLRLIALN